MENYKKKHAHTKSDSSKKWRSFLLLTIVRCPQLSRSYARCKITIFPSHHTVGAKKVLHFLYFQKRHFSVSLLNMAPKCLPRPIRGASESPFKIASETPFGAAKNAVQEGVSFLQNATSAAGRDFRSLVRVCVCVCLGVRIRWLRRR